MRLVSGRKCLEILQFLYPKVKGEGQRDEKCQKHIFGHNFWQDCPRHAWFRREWSLSTSPSYVYLRYDFWSKKLRTANILNFDIMTPKNRNRQFWSDFHKLVFVLLGMGSLKGISNFRTIGWKLWAWREQLTYWIFDLVTQKIEIVNFGPIFTILFWFSRNRIRKKHIKFQKDRMKIVGVLHAQSSPC